MLISLSIRDFVLIERLDLEFGAGLCVLTGETGAGKSILLDALGLASGGRAERGFIRNGATQASVTAVFDPAPQHAVRAVLSGNGLECDSALILRRIVSIDGRSRAFINDQPVSIGLLREAGSMLLEIHGQHDERGLMNAAGHRNLLDAFGGLSDDVTAVESAWRDLTGAQSAWAGESELAARAAQDSDYLKHMAEELRTLDPQTGEETELANARALMMAAEKIATDVHEAVEALAGQGGADAKLGLALRRLSRVQPHAQGRLDAAIGALDRAAIEMAEARRIVEAAERGLGFSPVQLERAETRLFALRAAARKYGGSCDQLAAKRADTEARLAALGDCQARLHQLEQMVEEKRRVYRQAASHLSAARGRAASALDARVLKELLPLKLQHALFRTQVEPLGDGAHGPQGCDRVEFLVATNPGTPFGALTRIASGGELARFVLALKVALADAGSAPTLIFDEVDRGVGGAVADAVGERLSRLARSEQVLVVTHSPQVAARATHHLRVAKVMAQGAMTTRIELLDAAGRREEIARMLAGAKITDAARAAADQLIAGANVLPAKKRRAT